MGKTAGTPVVLVRLPGLYCYSFSRSHIWRLPGFVIKLVLSFVLSGSSLMNIGCRNIFILVVMLSLCLFCSCDHSPALGVHSFTRVQSFNLSRHNQSPWRHSISHSLDGNSNSSLLAPETERIVPKLCIDHLWTEAITNTRFGVHIFILKEKCC